MRSNCLSNSSSIWHPFNVDGTMKWSMPSILNWTWAWFWFKMAGVRGWTTIGSSSCTGTKGWSESYRSLKVWKLLQWRTLSLKFLVTFTRNPRNGAPSGSWRWPWKAEGAKCTWTPAHRCQIDAFVAQVNFTNMSACVLSTVNEINQALELYTLSHGRFFFALHKKNGDERSQQFFAGENICRRGCSVASSLARDEFW